MKLLIILYIAIANSCIIQAQKSNIEINDLNSMLRKKTDSLIFRKLKCGLYANKAGDIGFLTYDNSYILQGGKKETRYLTYVYNADTTNKIDGGIKKLKSVIDIKTFSILSNFYFIDKEHVYIFNSMMDGGTISINWNIDPNSFKVLDYGYYAVDKSNAYFKGTKIKGADIKSFKLFNTKKLSQYAYDKNNFYSGNEIISKEEAKISGLKIELQ